MSDPFAGRSEISSEEYRSWLAAQGQTTLVIPPAAETVPDWQTNEKAFMARVVKFATEHGWNDPKPYHTFDSASSEPGFCDLVMVKVGVDGVGRLVIAELKVPGGRVTKAQRRWIDKLSKVVGVETYLWYPSDWESIQEILG